MVVKTFFVDLKGKGPRINSDGDYDEYLVRAGLKSDRYVYTDTLITKRFKGIVNGVSAKAQAQAFVVAAQQTLEPAPSPVSVAKGA